MHRDVRVSMGSSYAYNARLALVVDAGSARGRSTSPPVVVVVVVPDWAGRTTEVVGSPSAGAEKSLSGRVIAGPLVVVRVTASSTNAGTTKRTNLGALISSGEAV